MTTHDTPTILEGVFAIHKPSNLSSAQVIRDAQTAFQSSKLFAPWLQREEERITDLSHNQKQKRRSWKSRQPMQVKMGHGGTLDPMATGVLILGVGSGTKSLNTFLECTKSYETVVLFGAATDSYDAVGKIVARKDHSHVTKQSVEEVLTQFRGKIMQKPSIFSALKVNGKKMYEYAREGKELPVEIEARPVEVKELEMLEWMDGGKHEWRWPEEEAPKEQKAVVDKVLHLEESGADVESKTKRKREGDADGVDEAVGISPSPKRVKAESGGEIEPMMSGALPEETELVSNNDQLSSPPTKGRCPAPACRLQMTVTSGFYVRSLAHDLGAAVDSLGLMSSLVRTRQGDFSLGENVLDYDDLGKGEEVWGPKVENMLRDWESREGSSGKQKVGDETRGRNGDGMRNEPRRRRRNSSSPESDAGR